MYFNTICPWLRYIYMWHEHCFNIQCYPKRKRKGAGAPDVGKPDKVKGSTVDQMLKMSAFPKKISAHAGFSLAEVMTVIAIIGIVSAIAVPGFLGWLPDYYLKSAVRDLRAGFQLAKITAIKSGRNCTITFNQPVDGDTYDYVIFQDADNDLELDNSEITGIVKKIKWLDYHPSISGVSNSFTHNDDDLPAVAFRSNGIPRSNGNANALGMGRVSIKNTDNSEADMFMSSAGNIRIVFAIH